MAAEEPERPLDDHEVLPIARFRFALRRFETATDTLLRDCGLTPQRYLLLLAVRAGSASGGTATVSSISRELQMPQTTVTDLVARAVDVGLLEKAALAADGRVARITVTPEGDGRLARAVHRLRSGRHDLWHALVDASEAFPD